MASSLFFGKKRITKACPAIDSKFAGLKTLVDGNFDFPNLPHCGSCNLRVSKLMSPSLFMDENARQQIKIHVEKMEEVEPAEVELEETEDDDACWASYGRGHGKKLPPAIPLLARTTNSCHMPWVMKRIHKPDGSLVIKEVRMKRHEYIRTSRKNGRLVLQLMKLDESFPIFATHPMSEIEEEEKREVRNEKENDGPDETNESADFEATGTKEKDVASEISRIELSSLMMLPEPTFPEIDDEEWPCFNDDSLMLEMQMRLVSAQD